MHNLDIYSKVPAWVSSPVHCAYAVDSGMQDSMPSTHQAATGHFGHQKSSRLVVQSSSFNTTAYLLWKTAQSRLVQQLRPINASFTSSYNKRISIP